MEKITIAKALKNIVLPNGKTVHEGDEFVYEHDFENAGEFEIIGERNVKNDPEPEGQPNAALSVEEMKAIRLKAKDLKIANWHLKGIDKLIVEIAEAEAKTADEISPEAAEKKGKEPENTVEEISPEVVVSEMENTTEAPAPQQPENTPLA